MWKYRGLGLKTSHINSSYKHGNTSQAISCRLLYGRPRRVNHSFNRRFRWYMLNFIVFCIYSNISYIRIKSI